MKTALTKYRKFRQKTQNFQFKKTMLHSNKNSDRKINVTIVCNFSQDKFLKVEKQGKDIKGLGSRKTRW